MLTSPAGKTDVCLKCWHSVKKLLQGSPDSQSLHICSSHSFQVASWCSTSIQKFRSNSNLELDLPINANNYSVCIKKLRMLYRKKKERNVFEKHRKVKLIKYSTGAQTTHNTMMCLGFLNTVGILTAFLLPSFSLFFLIIFFSMLAEEVCSSIIIYSH